MKKLIITLILLLCSASYAFASYVDEYPWAANAVTYYVDKGMLKGDLSGDLILGNSLTQSQACALLMRSFTVAPRSYGGNIISGDHWAAADVMALSGYFILPAEFNADAAASREMFISTLVSAMGLDTSYTSSVLEESFSDCSQVRAEYAPYLAAAYKNGLMNGTDGRINPKSYLTRAEAVVLLYRAIGEPPVAQPSVIQSHTPLLGAPEVTVERAKTWARARGAHERFIQIAETYWMHGEMTGIRPEVLYAQAAKETGYGNYGGRVLPEMNNWAGIKKYGATGDETDDHESFSTPYDGVRAHFNHMSAYIGLAPIGTPHGRYNSVVTLSWAGTVKYVEELGGKWCPDPLYGVQIVEMVNTMKN